MGQSGRFLSRLLGPLLKTGLPLIGNIFKSLAESVLLPIGSTAAASATNAATRRKMFRSGTTTLIICKKEMNDTMKIVMSLEESGLLMKGAKQSKLN